MPPSYTSNPHYASLPFLPKHFIKVGGEREARSDKAQKLASMEGKEVDDDDDDDDDDVSITMQFQPIVQIVCRGFVRLDT